jgi:hypothetical protein
VITSEYTAGSFANGSAGASNDIVPCQNRHRWCPATLEAGHSASLWARHSEARRMINTRPGVLEFSLRSYDIDIVYNHRRATALTIRYH